MINNLNSTLSEEFMDRRMIMDDIIAYGNKDEAENNENETYKITDGTANGKLEVNTKKYIGNSSKS